MNFIDHRHTLSGITYDMHMHDFYEFLLVCSENVTITYETITIEATKGDMIIFPPFTIHKVDSHQKPYERFTGQFSYDRVIASASCAAPILDYIASKRPFFIKLDDASYETVRKLVYDGKASYVSTAPNREFELTFVLCSILNIAMNIHEKTAHTDSSSYVHTPSLPMEILKYISENYTYDLTIEHITKKFGLSHTSLHNMMKKYVNLSFKEYIIRLRIAKAMELLYKGMSVTEAASYSGFNSYAHFIRIFTQRVGISPKKYKQTVTNNDAYISFISNN